MASEERTYATRDRLVPMTDEVRALLRREIASAGSRFTRAVLLGSALMLLLIAVGAWRLLPGPIPIDIGIKLVLVGLGIYVAFMAIVLVDDVVPLWRDLSSSDYRRECGLAVAEGEWDYRFFYKLSINTERLRSPWHKEGDAPFSTLEDATVDYTRHARLVLGIQNGAGRVIYRLTGYRGMAS